MNRKASIIFTTTGAIAGCVLFSLAFRMVLVPLHLYSGGFLGVAQLIQELLSYAIPHVLDSKSTRSVALIMPETLEFPWVCGILKI